MERVNEWCDRCKEEFPIAPKEEQTRIRMGFLYPKQKIPARARRHYTCNAGTSNYLCGNCYFDILDLLEEAQLRVG